MSEPPAVFELNRSDGVDLDGCLALVKAAQPRLTPHKPHQDVCALAAHSQQRHQCAVRARHAAADFLNEHFAGGQDILRFRVYFEGSAPCSSQRDVALTVTRGPPAIQ